MRHLVWRIGACVRLWQASKAVCGSRHSYNPFMDRLNKYLAHAGVGSRRHCDELMAAGRVRIDGRVVRELGTRVEAGQRVSVDGAPIKSERHVYWLVNKPRGVLCTNHDPARRP